MGLRCAFSRLFSPLYADKLDTTFKLYDFLEKSGDKAKFVLKINPPSANPPVNPAPQPPPSSQPKEPPKKEIPDSKPVEKVAPLKPKEVNEVKPSQEVEKPKAQPPKVEVPKIDTHKAETPKPEPPKIDTPKPKVAPVAEPIKRPQQNGAALSFLARNDNEVAPPLTCPPPSASVVCDFLFSSIPFVLLPFVCRFPAKHVLYCR